ncbi:MAG: glutamyl-tRNA reductase, partial [bacterium]
VSPEFLLNFLAERKSIPPEEISSHTYTFTDGDAVEHLFRVCASLDSMVVGETQITSQVKDAYSVCCSCRCNGTLLNRLLHCAFAVSKRVRNSTNISQGSLSVSFTACDLVQKILGSLEGCSVLLIGAGETGQLVARHLVERGVNNLLITNRTFERAKEVAERLNAEAFPMDQLPERLRQVEVVVSATMSDEYLLTKPQIEEAVADRSAPLVCIDLGVPRDIDPQVEKLDKVSLHNIDDLESLVESNRRRRHDEIHKGFEVVREERDNFVEWFRMHRAAPTIEELQKMLDQLRANEMEPLQSVLSKKEYKLVDRVTRSLIKKILQHPIVHLKEAARQDDSIGQIRFIGDILGVHDE